LTNDITSQADYVAVLKTDNTKAHLSGWVFVNNTFGATYTGASSRWRPRQFMAAGAMEQAPAALQFEEGSFFAYQLYNFDRQTTVKDKQSKQVTLLSSSDIPITKRQCCFRNKKRYRQQPQYGAT